MREIEANEEDINKSNVVVPGETIGNESLLEHLLDGGVDVHGPRGGSGARNVISLKMWSYFLTCVRFEWVVALTSTSDILSSLM